MIEETPKQENKPLTVLAVDDEEINLGIMEEYLQRSNYRPLLARNGGEALQVLQEFFHEIDIVLLDRMMPDMDGIEVLKIMKNHPEYQKIPVIMQTAAATTHEIIEGVNGGAYYYLTKPYDKQTLLSIVNSAARYIEKYKRFEAQHDDNTLILDCTVTSHYRFQTIEQCNKLALYLGKMCPLKQNSHFHHAEISYGLYELMLNAIEHGNLGISYDEKTELLSEDKQRWMAEIQRRSELPENQDKYVDLHYYQQEDTVKIIISDSGSGFNWEPFLEIDPLRAMDNHGRGIAMANLIFDKLEYQGCGNKVECEINMNREDE